MQKQIGDGQTSKVWKDPWLPTIPPRPATCNVSNSYLKICELWKTGKMNGMKINYQIF